MVDEDELADVRREVAQRRFQDLIRRARRLSGMSPGETLEAGLSMIESVHSLEVRPL